jgi:hypothetical protein
MDFRLPIWQLVQALLILLEGLSSRRGSPFFQFVKRTNDRFRGFVFALLFNQDSFNYRKEAGGMSRRYRKKKGKDPYHTPPAVFEGRSLPADPAATLAMGASYW